MQQFLLNRPYHLVLIILFFFVLMNNIFGQSIADHRHKLGGVMGYGSHHLLQIDYDYRVFLVQGQYYYSVVQRASWGLEILVQPQINSSRYRFSEVDRNLKKGFETGLNVGLLWRRNWSADHWSVYVCLSAGPHYVSGVPERQTNGFIFSDNLFAGLQARIKRDFYADFRVGYRHISNAQLKLPNGGINSLIFGVGFMTLL